MLKSSATYFAISVLMLVTSCTMTKFPGVPREYLASQECNHFQGEFNNISISVDPKVRKNIRPTLLTFLGVTGIPTNEEYRIQLDYRENKTWYIIYLPTGDIPIARGVLNTYKCFGGYIFSPRLTSGEEKKWLIMAYHYSDRMYINDHGNLVVESEISTEGFIFFISLKYFAFISHEFLALQQPPK